ncbi:hypothetical protein EVAR_76979_1 [Eumeta japonica]|uniref:Uncharacterized protein n=1 Tax=Eumeta variegata TaxID=151549 RepID=A0A4C1SF93_EUMVA|nr:hypothetical protein EVAR_76979_1 [Eumeta japonica]
MPRDIFYGTGFRARRYIHYASSRAFAKLPYELSEITKIDIVYGLLDRRIRKRVPRELIHSLDVLVNKSRLVKESLAEAVTTKAGAADRVSAPGRLPGTGRVEWPARAATASSPGAGGRAAACSAPSMSHASPRAPLSTRVVLLRPVSPRPERRITVTRIRALFRIYGS